MNTGILEEMTIDEVRTFDPEVVVWCIGSVEPHGPALPYGTDYWQADATVRAGVTKANRQTARVMYPTLPIGNNANMQAFPFACRIGPETLMQVVLDVIEALEQDGVRKIVLFNGHGGNTDSLRATLRAHAHRHRPGEGAFVCVTSYDWPADIVANAYQHGGVAETSLIMHLRGETVREDKLGVFPKGELAVNALDDPSVYYVMPWNLHVPLSAGGDVRESSADKGKALLEHSSDTLAKLLVELSQAKWTEHFPFKK